MRLDVIFRSCSRVYGLHGNSRIVNCTKTELIHRCLNSLIQSMNLAVGPQGTEFSLKVVDDHSDPECVDGIKTLLKTGRFPTELIHLEATGNGASLKKTYSLGREAQELIYFVEDDYLHAPNAIQEMLSSYQQLSFFLNQDVVLYPCDEAQNYTNVSTTPLVVSANRHWRGLQGTTATQLISKKVFMEYWHLFEALTGYDPKGGPDSPNESNTINLIYRTVPCLGPIPALAAHVVNSALMPPVVNWIEWWNAADPKNLLQDRPRLLTEFINPEPAENGRGPMQMKMLLNDQFKGAMILQGRAGQVQEKQHHTVGWRYFYLLKGALEYSYQAVGSSAEPMKIQLKEGNLFFVPAMTEYAMTFSSDCEILCLENLSRSASEASLMTSSSKTNLGEMEK